MSDLTARVLMSFLVAAFIFAVVLLGMSLLATAPALFFLFGLFGLVWAVLFSMIHVRPRR